MDEHVVGTRREDVVRIAKEENPDLPLNTSKEVLNNIKVGSILPENYTLFDVQKDASVETGLQMLKKHGVLSLPVFDKSKQKHVSFIDVVDIVHFVLETATEAEIMKGPASYFVNSRFKSTTCGELANKSLRNPWAPVQIGAPLRSAVDILTNTRIHRVPIVDGEGNLETVLTESTVLANVAPHIDKFANATKTVDELQLGIKDVISVGLDALAKDAFAVLQKENISAVAVVDADGKLCGNLSVSDMKIVQDDFSKMYLTVSAFVKFIPKNELIPGPIAVSGATTVEELVLKLRETRVHRAYVVDGNQKPIGVISLTDVLKKVFTDS